jgi:protein gp37
LQLKAWLNRAKEICVFEQIEWLAWLERETDLPRRTASWYMSYDPNKGPDESDMGNVAHDLPDASEIAPTVPIRSEAPEPVPEETAEEGDGVEPEVEVEADSAVPVVPFRTALPVLDEVKEEDEVKSFTVGQWQEMSEGQRRTLLEEAGSARRCVFNAQNDNENIDWAKYSWNPVTGCEHDCPYCYARPIGNMRYPHGFKPAFWPDRLKARHNTPFPRELARRWVGYRNVFVCSMADLFGGWVPREWIDAVLAECAAAPKWNFLFLTKYPNRMAEFTFSENCWVGTTVDCQARVKNAEKAFRKIKAGVKWLSLEPILEPLKFTDLGLFQWIVLGGASATATTPEWRPPRRWVEAVEREARRLKIPYYEKTNLHARVLGYPGQEVYREPTQAPEAMRYLPGDKG